MSKIAVNETYGGNMLRKAIDYFCHLAVAPEFLPRIEKGDKAFAASEFLPKMRWLKDVNDDIYDPTYTDMLRVAFTSEFGRGKLQDLVALLSGRNFETKQYEEARRRGVVRPPQEGHPRLHQQDPLRPHHDDPALGRVRHQRPDRRPERVNFAYILYLRGRAEGMPAADIERLVRRWYAMSILRGRYTGSPETAFDFDIRQIEAAAWPYADAVIEPSCPTASGPGCCRSSWTPRRAEPVLPRYQAAQVKLGDKGFLSRDITVRDLLLNRSDVHHVYPAQSPEGSRGLTRGRYNQIANFVLAQSEINIAIGDHSAALGGDRAAASLESHRLQAPDGPFR
jgi:hypothetical protein